MTDDIEVYATDEHGRHITRTVITGPAATDHTLIATAELEQLRFDGQNADTLRKDNTRLREEATQLRINAEKDVCSGCMQREEQRDHWMEATRQNGVAFEQAKQAWYREKDRTKQAEAVIARARQEAAAIRAETDAYATTHNPDCDCDHIPATRQTVDRILAALNGETT